MKKTFIGLLVIATLGLGGLTESVLASGTYTGRLPQPTLDPKAITKTERAYYGLGQRIYTGKLKVKAWPEADVQAQHKQLTALQGLLPERVARKKDLTTFTGKLSEQQLRALTYYVKRRFTPNADVQP